MYLSERFRDFLMLVYALLMPVEVWAALPVKPVEIRLEGEVKVSSERLTLGDVATIYARNLRDFEALSSLVLPQFPSDSTQFSISSQYVRQRVSEVLGGREFALHAPAQISFVMDRPGIDPRDIGIELLARGRESGKIPEWAEAEVFPAGGFEQLKGLRPGSYRIEPGSQQAQWRGEMPFKVLVNSGATQNVIWVRAKIKWFTESWVAVAPIRFQQNLDASAFRKMRVEVTDTREELVPGTEEGLAAVLRSARAKRSILSNAPLTTAMIDRRPDAAAGQRLKVVFVSESGLRVSADGALLGSASVGEGAKVRLNSSRKIVSGKLVSDGVMEVSL